MRIPTAKELRERPAGQTIGQQHALVVQAITDRVEAAQEVLRKAEAADRVNPGTLLASERRAVDAHEDEIRKLNVLTNTIEMSPESHEIDYGQIGRRSIDLDKLDVIWHGEDGRPGSGAHAAYEVGRPLNRSQTVTGFTQSRGADHGHIRPGEERLDLEKYLLGVVTGRWDGAEPERRAMSEGVLSAGGYQVPTILSSMLIDLMRNQTRVMAAGAHIVPMLSPFTNVAKWTGDPTNAWRLENALITESDATMSVVQLRAKSLATLTTVSRELLEDAPNVGAELAVAFSKSFAITVDSASLYGTGVNPVPLGVRNTSGIGVVSMGTNGAALTNYDPFVNAVGALQNANETPSNSVICAPRTVQEQAKLKDTLGQPMRKPDLLADTQFLPTNQVPINLTQGSASTASDAFVANWEELLIGVRTQLIIEPLPGRYAEFGQVGFVAWWRGDIQVARPAAFCVLEGIL
jgi:HK97 family phage major capsid protein